MELKIYYDQDADLGLIQKHTVAVIGYGNQGHAHALNLKDSGVNVIVGLASDSKSVDKARSDGLEVRDIASASAKADCIMLLLPDEVASEVYADQIAPHLSSGKYLAVAHGFNIHFGKIKIPGGVNTFMVSPKGPGRQLRSHFLAGSGLACLIAVKEGSSAQTKDVALSYSKAIGGTRVGVIETSFREETETDLFGEQAVLCGGIPELIKAGFETLVEAGYHPAMAYLECLHEVKLITDLIYEHGLKGMHAAISNTAEYGGYQTGPKLIDAQVKQKMKQVLANIQSGQFADKWIDEVRSGSHNFLAKRRSEDNHPIEAIGALVREKINK